MRRTFSFLLMLAVIAGLSNHALAARPNLLLIVADDLTWLDLGFTGNTDVKSPNLDRLAREGMTLRNTFTPAAQCSPARHALYTGLFPVRSGAYPNHSRVRTGTKSIFSHLKAMGYRVGLQGKSHVRPPESFPYEYIREDTDNMRAMAEFIGRDKSQPWFAVLASHEPHSPWNRGPKHLYNPRNLKVPAYLHDNADTRKALAAYYAEITDLDNQVGGILKVLADSGQADNTLVTFVSEQGSSMPYGGKWSVYDNGIRAAAVARWPARIKPGATSKALIQYVDVAPTLIAAAGGEPTKIDTGTADGRGHRGFDGRSFLDVLLGKTDRLREYVFAENTTVGVIGYKEPYPMRAVRDAHYKLIRNLAPQNEFNIRGLHRSALAESWRADARRDRELNQRMERLSKRPAEELYELDSDPLENRNLASDPRLAAVKSRLEKELDAWMAQQGDKGMQTEIAALSHQAKPSAGDFTENDEEDSASMVTRPKAARSGARKRRGGV